MPHHWFFIDPDNPGPRQRAGSVRKGVGRLGGRLVFVGRERDDPKRWYALVYLKKDDEATLSALRKEIGIQKDIVLEEVIPEGEDPPRETM